MSTEYSPRHAARGTQSAAGRSRSTVTAEPAADTASVSRSRRTDQTTAPAAPAATGPTKAPAGSDAVAASGKSRGILLLFIGLMLIMLMSSLNQTVLSPALPTIVGELDGVEHMSWVITAFILVSTIMMPIYGKLGDLWGRKPLLIFAIIAFSAGSVTGALSDSMTTLIISRGLQGLGGGGLMILSQAVIADVIPARERGKYMGALMGVFAFSSVAGPLLGGWLTEGPGWRWGFWMNVPLGVLALLAAIFLIPHTNRVERTERARIDVLGMALLAAATACLVLAMTWGGNQYDWNSPTIIGLLVATVVAVLVFIPVEMKASEPVMPLVLFADRNFNLTVIASLCMGIAMFGAIGYMPTYMQMVLGVDATAAGLLMIPMMGTMLITSVAVGVIVSKVGRYKAFMVVGSLLIAAGLYFLSRLEVDTETYKICLALAVIGLGLGMSMQLLTLVVQNSFPLKMVGTATASANFFRQVGATVGSALVGGLFTARLKDLLEERLAPIIAQAQQSGQPMSLGSTNSLTPAVVNALPDQIREIIVGAYNDALTPIFFWIMPLGIIAAVVLLFLQEKDLATTVDGSGRSETTSHGRPAAHDDGTAGRREGSVEDQLEESSPRTGEIPIPEPGTYVRMR